MEIGPIAGIRPITMVKPLSSSRDLTGVFAIEFRGQDQDEAPSQHRAARGLEDEASEEESLLDREEESREKLSLESDGQPVTRRMVNYFA